MSGAALARPALVIVAAVADNGVIGQGNALPFRLPSDLKRFKALTLGKPIVMGRKTFQSIGKALPGRTNIVVTRDPAFMAAGATVAPSPERALEIATADCARRGASEIMVIGGGELYALAMPFAERLEITHVHAMPAGDAHFPTIDLATWEKRARSLRALAPGDAIETSYVSYRRNAPAAVNAAERRVVSP